MNPPILWLLLGELALLLSGTGLAWIVLGWRRQRQRSRAITDFIDGTEKNHRERAEIYRQWLQQHLKLNDEQIDHTTDQWLEAEKLFWRAALSWQLQPSPLTLAEMPGHLRRLIDDRLEALAQAVEKSSAPQENQADFPDTATNELSILEEFTDNDEANRETAGDDVTSAGEASAETTGNPPPK
ncbi:hypothetical protein [Methylohalobius crimeensis]|uniref:hypothetical protein n=1 Tax=Methylohalobius crimeensis TaxID=244365 RepID=UPI0003B5C491|nr:hypothetical protein [Methylohalobius crimeensis]